jgi:hypothetical protein
MTRDEALEELAQDWENLAQFDGTIKMRQAAHMLRSIFSTTNDHVSLCEICGKPESHFAHNQDGHTFQSTEELYTETCPRCFLSFTATRPTEGSAEPDRTKALELRKSEKQLLANLETVDVQPRTVTLTVSTALWENWQSDYKAHMTTEGSAEPGDLREALIKCGDAIVEMRGFISSTDYDQSVQDVPNNDDMNRWDAALNHARDVLASRPTLAHPPDGGLREVAQRVLDAIDRAEAEDDDLPDGIDGDLIDDLRSALSASAGEPEVKHG